MARHLTRPRRLWPLPRPQPPAAARGPGMTPADRMARGGPGGAFERMTSYGKAKLQAALVLPAPANRKRKR